MAAFALVAVSQFFKFCLFLLTHQKDSTEDLEKFPVTKHTCIYIHPISQRCESSPGEGLQDVLEKTFSFFFLELHFMQREENAKLKIS